MRNLNSLTAPRKGGNLIVSNKWIWLPLCFGMSFHHMLEDLDALKTKYKVHMVKVPPNSRKVGRSRELMKK